MISPTPTAPEPMTTEPFAALEFGPFRLVPRRRQLLRDGVPVRIGARAFDLLVLLASRAGQIVPHAQLIGHAWPNRVVCDCNLKVQIATLQKVLGPMATGGRHIESVALRGYLFVADVRRLTWTALDDAGVAQPRGERLVFVVDIPAGSMAAHESTLAGLIAQLRALT